MASVAPGGQPASALGGELDPLFVKALRLFHSTSKDSVHQVIQGLNKVFEKKFDVCICFAAEGDAG